MGCNIIRHSITIILTVKKCIIIILHNNKNLPLYCIRNLPRKIFRRILYLSLPNEMMMAGRW